MFQFFKLTGPANSVYQATRPADRLIPFTYYIGSIHTLQLNNNHFYLGAETDNSLAGSISEITSGIMPNLT